MIVDPMNFDSPSSIISLFEDDDSRWNAVVNRNGNADGFFVYAVKTTKIYCRPICKARLARRSNVSFFTYGSEAEAAGFRACKRCKPDIHGFMPEESAVRKIRSFMINRAAGKGGNQMMSLSQMAKQTGLSKWHFHRVFKKSVGMTPTEYLREQKSAQYQQDLHAQSQEDWMQEFDKKAFDMNADFSWLEEPVAEAAAPATTQAEATNMNDVAAWVMEDFVRWPEEETRGAP